MESPTKYCSAAFVVKNGLYLLGKRSDANAWYAGVWDIFGGHMERGEDASRALKRELQEELGIVPTGFELFEIVDATMEDPVGSLRLYIYFVTGWEGGDPRNCSSEHSEIKWFTRADLDLLELAHTGYLLLIDKWAETNEPT